MIPHPFLDAVFVLVILLNLVMLATSRLSGCIRIFALQSALLALLPVAGEESCMGEAPGLHACLIALGAIGLKVVLIPAVLQRVLRSGEIHKEIEPFIGFTASVFIGALVVVGSFALAALAAPTEPMSDLVLPTAIATMFIGLLTLVSRVKAITQVIGFLVLENGIFTFGLMLLKQTLLVELGILLDLFVGVFVMGIVVYHIRREFDHMDTHLLDALKES